MSHSKNSVTKYTHRWWCNCFKQWEYKSVTDSAFQVLQTLASWLARKPKTKETRWTKLWEFHSFLQQSSLWQSKDKVRKSIYIFWWSRLIPNFFCADLCLPIPMVELDVHVVVVRASEPNLCSNSTYKEQLQRAAMQNYRPPRDANCRIESFAESECEIASEWDFAGFCWKLWLCQAFIVNVLAQPW